MTTPDPGPAIGTQIILDHSLLCNEFKQLHSKYGTSLPQFNSGLTTDVRNTVKMIFHDDHKSRVKIGTVRLRP